MVGSGALAVTRKYTPPYARKAPVDIVAAMALYDEAVREDALAALRGEADKMADEIETFAQSRGEAPTVRRFWWQDE